MRVRLFGCLRRPTCEFFVGGVLPVSDSTMLSRAPLAIVLLFTLRQYYYYHYYYAHANIYIYIYLYHLITVMQGYSWMHVLCKWIR